MAKYEAFFEITNQAGELFKHCENFRVCGLDRVHVRERKSERLIDQSGTVCRYRAASSRPFVIVILSDQWIKESRWQIEDRSSVTAVEAKEISTATRVA
jgi:hypothetical protein